jgi:hypothetical protein
MLESSKMLKFLTPLVGALVLFLSSMDGPAVDPAEVGVARQEMPTPGPEHKWLAGRVGTWNVTTKMKMGPDADWKESKGTETCTMVCGGFWQLCTHKGTMMDMPFEGRMQLGYDQIRKKFVGTWIDSFGSYLTVMEGSLTDDKKVLTLHSDMLDPQTGKTTKVRMVTTVVSEDRATFKMFMPGADGKEFEGMSQVLTRSK